jgi:hypothetical protein
MKTKRMMPSVLLVLLIAMGGSVAQYLFAKSSSRAFCAAVKDGETSEFVEVAATKAGFEVYPFPQGDGVLLARHHYGIPPGSFSCQVRYERGRVRKTVFFID